MSKEIYVNDYDIKRALNHIPKFKMGDIVKNFLSEKKIVDVRYLSKELDEKAESSLSKIYKKFISEYDTWKIFCDKTDSEKVILPLCYVYQHLKGKKLIFIKPCFIMDTDHILSFEKGYWE